MLRRKSIDSSDSSDSDSSNSSSKSHKVKKDKKEKKEKKDKKDKHKKDKSDKEHKTKGSDKPFQSSIPEPSFPQAPASNSYYHHQQPAQFPPVAPLAAIPAMSYGSFNDPDTQFNNRGHGQQHHSGGFAPPQPHHEPPAYNKPHAPPPPPSGYRVPLTTQSAFPPPNQCGHPPLYDADGASPIYIGSALFDNSVHPCKIGPHLSPTFCAVPYAGTEYSHTGRYDLLPFVAEQMEWVPASNGRLPHGRRPVEGGYEENGNKLYHALAHVEGVRVPGKTGEHLNGANVPFGGREIGVQQYEILCWK